MIAYLTAYLTTAMVFFAIDLIWLSKVARKFYFDRLGSLLLPKPRLAAAALFYAVYVVGIVIFAVNPSLSDGTVAVAIHNGSLFGFFAYATYDMTNYATLKNWPLSVVIVDILWGSFVTAISAAAGFWLTSLFISI